MLLTANLLLTPLLILIQTCNANNPSMEMSYRKGVDAYTGERWSECIAQFEEALHLFRQYRTVLLNCRMSCHASNTDSEMEYDIEGLNFYEKLFKIKNCIQKCQNDGFNRIQMFSDLDETMVTYMQHLMPYDYLHICYFQMNKLQKAASAAFTYLTVNPDDETMKNNLAYYIQQPEVDKDLIVDLEGEDYKSLFRYGLKSYNEGKWKETVMALDRVLVEYISSENKCRAECERRPEQEWSPEIVVTLSNNIAALIQCRQQCQHRLKLLNYHSGVAFLADVLNYLQISNYHLNKIESAAEAVASYLELVANDEDMLANKKIYSTLTDSNQIHPRNDIVYYSKRDKYEKHTLKIFYEGVDSTSSVFNSI